MCARLSGNILFYFFADNFTGSKDTEPYKSDVSFLCQYTVPPKSFSRKFLLQRIFEASDTRV